MDKKGENEPILIAPDNFSFPFTPYSIQVNFMKALYETLEHAKLGIFESPTGTGKSLSIACASLQWLKDHEKRQVSNLTRRIEEIDIELNDSSSGQDWITEQYSYRLCNEQKNKILDELKQINKINERIQKIKSKKKSDDTTQSTFSQTNKNNAGPELNIEDSDFLLEHIENSIEEMDEVQEEAVSTRPTQILFCSRTHSQLSQMIGEISKSPHNDIRVVTLASRQNYCINTSVRNLKHNSAINEKCLELQKNNSSKTTRADKDNRTTKRKKVAMEKSCMFKNKTNIEKLHENIITEIIDVEDLLKQGKSLSACPYYACRISLEDGQFIALPYQTLLCKRTREISGVVIKNNIVIIDEAHNLLDTISSIHNIVVSFVQLKFVYRILQAYQKKYGTRLSPKNYLSVSQLLYINKQLLKIFEKADKNTSKIHTAVDFVFHGEFDNINIIPLVDFCEKNKLAQKVAGFAIKCSTELDENELQKGKSEKGVKAFLENIESNTMSRNKKCQESKDTTLRIDDICDPKSNINENLLSPINCMYAVLAFLERLTDKCDDGRIVVVKGKDESKHFIKYLLLNPGAHFQDIVKDARSVIVAGGTMQPFTDFKLQLFGESELHRVTEFSCGHVVPAESLCPIVMSRGPSGKNLLFNYSNRSNSELLKELSMIIQNICNVTPGGIVCFFPSYDYEQQVYDFLQQSRTLNNIEKRKTVFREPKNSNEIEKVLQKYIKCIKDTRERKTSITGGLMMGVVGGKISEGLNFSDDLGRCVIVVGMPYPNKTNIELLEKIKYLNCVVSNNAGDIYYDNLCFKAVNQCIGRAIRHINDYAAIVLLDERYSKPSNYMKLSGWIQSSLKVPQSFGQCQGLLSMFFNKKKNG